MDTVLQAFLTWQFLFFCLAIGAVVFVIRQVVEYWMENGWPLKQWAAANKDSKLWRGLLLPILPIFLGLAGGLLAKGYAYPEGFNSTSARVAFGLVAGFTSGIVVRLFNTFLSDKVSEFKSNIQNRMSPPKDPPACDDVPSDDVPKRGQP